MHAKLFRTAARAVGGFVGLAACSVAWAQGVRYEVVPIEHLYGSMDGGDISDLGVVTGSYEETPPGATFLLDKTLSVLPRLPGSTSNWGLRINRHNAIVGRANVDGTYHSVLWLDGKPIDLNMTYDESGGDSATDLNDSLQISAYVDGRPAVWEAGKVTFLPVPLGSGTAGAIGINNVGDAVGSVHLPDLRAAKWVEGIYRDLHPAGYDESFATHIADNGDIGGEVSRPGLNNAALWRANGEFIDLGSLGPGMPSYFRDLNSKGQVVGLSAIDGQFRGFLWDNGAMHSLSDLVPFGWTIINARAINERGQILATGRLGDLNGAILLNPVPEPASFAVLACLLIALKFRFSARQRK
ncbi:MAG: DUF3466 family protein [Armatimonadota bacterium]|nr:DUF3466 family protein [Armatimonadota bacterium]